MALIKCPNCGADISDKAYKCPKCGKELRVAVADSSDDSPSRSVPKRNDANGSITITRKAAFILVSIVAFLLIIFVATFAYLMGANKTRADSDAIVEAEANEDLDIGSTEVSNSGGTSSTVIDVEKAVDANEDSSEKEETEGLEQADYSNASLGMQNALQKANQILSVSAYSYQGMIDRLERDGYTSEEAKFGADNCGADWKEEAKKKAESILAVSAYSYQGMIDRLGREQFTADEAKYGADSCGADWKEEAKKKAESILSVSAYSYQGMIDRLGREQFTADEAKYGTDNCGADWKEEAKKKAESVLSVSTYSKEGLKDRLRREGFTEEEIEYAVKNFSF